MKCPSCEHVNDPAAKACSACGKPLKPRRKRRGDDENTPLTPEGEAFLRRATWVFRVGLWSLVPLAGLVLGPVALAWALRLRGPDQPGRPLVRVAFWLGALSAGTQWAGLALILASSGWGR